MKLIESVGVNGKNNSQDIKSVQISLNQLLSIIKPTRQLKIDGSLGARPEASKTVAAIKIFQKKVVGLMQPDGRIDPNKKTHQCINKKLSMIFSKNSSVSAMGQLKTILRSKLEKYEGRVEHMYLDTKGHVTIGVGHLIKSAAAESIGLIYSDSKKVASADDIRREYNTIKAEPFGKKYLARYYKSLTQLILPNKEIDRLTDKHILSFESELKKIYGFKEFKSFPKEVKLALFDMIFNLGMTKLRIQFVKFNAAIKSFDWATAASQSRRKNIAIERNTYVKNLLLKAGSDTHMIH